MKNLKKIIAIMLSIVMLFISSALAAENFDDDGNRDNENGLSDEEQNVLINDSHPMHDLDNPDDVYTEDIDYDEYIRGRNEYNEIVKKLTACDMWVPIDSGTYLENIKAGDFFLSVCRYINMNSFYDDNADREIMWKKSYDTLRSLNYIDFNIKTDENITYNKAARIIVNVLGYRDLAQMYGGTDSDYIRVVSDYNLISHLPDNLSSEMTRAEAALLIEDTLEADARVFYGNNDYRYINALEYYKNSFKITGIVEAVSDCSVMNGNTIEDGIRIGNYTLVSDRKDLYDYLACKTEAYYREEKNGDRTLLYISYHNKNSMITIEGDDIESLKKNTIVYNESESVKKKKLTLNSEAIEIFDRFSPKDIDSADFENCDYIKLIDNDNDGKYDVVFVYKYDIMLVERIVQSQNMIYGLYNDNEKGELKVDFNSGDVELTDRMGNPVDSYYITKDSVLSVAADAESGRQKIIVSNLMYTGVVKSVIGDKEVKFEDRSYMYSVNADYYKNTKAMSVGNKYTVYLDYRGRIAGYDLLKTDEMQYGFLIKAWLDTDTGSQRVGVKLLPYTGDMAEFYLAKKTKIDGNNCKSAVSMLEALRDASLYQESTLISIDSSYEAMNMNESNLIYARVPVMYKLNTDGEVKYIDTPNHGASENTEQNDIFHDNTMTMYNDFSKRTSAVKPGGMYLRNTLAFNSDNGNNVALNSKTKVFVVPVSNNVSDINDDKQYLKTNLTYFDDWNYYPKEGAQYIVGNRLEAYNVDETRTAGVLVYYTSDAVPEIDKKVPLTVVDEVIQTIDENDNVVRRLIGWQGNARIYVDFAEDVYFTRYFNGPNGSQIVSRVRHGDIIRFVTNNEGKLIDYIKVFSLSDEDDPDYVKAGNEEGTNVDPLTLNRTLLAVSDGKYEKNGHNSPHIYTALGNYNYGATYRLVYGTLLYKNGTNLVIKTKVDTALGQIDRIEIADFSGYNVLMIDEETDEIYVPTEDELLAEHGAGKAASKVILHTEGGKQRQLIIIKRAE